MPGTKPLLVAGSAPNGLVPIGVCAAVLLAGGGALASVTISSGATQNMSCSNGICTPTAAMAVLNVGDLETLLAAGNATVETTGTGVQAKDVAVKAPVTWSSNSVLALDAYRSIAVNQPVSIAGPAGLALVTNDGKKGNSGTLSFGQRGNVTFANLSSSLTINGAAFTLVGDLKTLASDIAANPNGNFALANSYDASGDGTYNQSVVPTEYGGTFTGLGNVVSNLKVTGGNLKDASVGLFARVGSPGVLESVILVSTEVAAAESVKYVSAGALAGANYGTIAFAHASGKLTVGKYSDGGGLVGANAGVIMNSSADTRATGNGFDARIGGLVGDNENIIRNSHAAGITTLHGSNGEEGGLAGYNGGTIETSYFTGNVRAVSNRESYEISSVGGLVGINDGRISSSYASGSVTGGNYCYVGGLVGEDDVSSTIATSYSTGAVAAGETGSIVGGLIGVDGAAAGSLTDNYWDTDTSGISNLDQGAGQPLNDPGITGLTTAQFQSGLPAGFDPKVWAENTMINEGFPYLRSNPPRKR